MNSSDPINQPSKAPHSFQKEGEKSQSRVDELIQKVINQLNNNEISIDEYQKTLSFLKKELAPIPKEMQQAFQEAEESGGLSANEMEKAYRFVMRQLPVKEERHIRKEQSGLKNALRIIPGKNKRDISVVIFDNESKPILGGEKIIRPAYGFFPYSFW